MLAAIVFFPRRQAAGDGLPTETALLRRVAKSNNGTALRDDRASPLTMQSLNGMRLPTLRAEVKDRQDDDHQ
jgi:hypothetical protein